MTLIALMIGLPAIGVRGTLLLFGELLLLSVSVVILWEMGYLRDRRAWILAALFGVLVVIAPFALNDPSYLLSSELFLGTAFVIIVLTQLAKRRRRRSTVEKNRSGKE